MKAEEERFGFSAIDASRCLCSALRARAAEKHGAAKYKGTDPAARIGSSLKAPHCGPFRALTVFESLPYICATEKATQWVAFSV